MDKEKEVEESMNHMVLLTERQSVTISGIVKMDSFDSEEFLLETTSGYLGIRGKNLEIVKLDTYQGNITIKGQIDSLTYLNDESRKENSVFSRLFK